MIISVQAPNATGTVNKSFRYNIDTPFLIRKPRQVYIDSAGNIFFADYDNHSVWKIDAATGAIVRVAGTGTSGSGGDGGPATEAELDNPRGVCTDAFGNVYIADTDNNRIRKVSAGFISTVVNTSGAAGDSGDGGPATVAQLRKPFGVRADAAGNIYIADTDNHRIRKVTAATGIISTIVNTAGNPTDGSHPLGDGGRRHSGNAQETIVGFCRQRPEHLYRRYGQSPDQKSNGGDRDYHDRRRHRPRLCGRRRGRNVGTGSTAPTGSGWMPPETSSLPIRETTGSEK